MNYRYSLLLPGILVVLLFVGSASAPFVCPGIPPAPYNPKSPQEDIVKVEAWMEQPHDQLLLKVTFAAPTPPTGQILVIILTGQDGSTETVLNCWSYSDPTATTYGVLQTGLPSANTPIAVYAYLSPGPSTDRAPNSGFYQITSLSAAAPNRFDDPDGPVGGVVLPTNRIALATPYLALAGLAAVVSAVVVVKRRRD